MGNLTKDPEIKYTPKGTCVCEIGIAINRQWKNEANEKQEEVTFVNVSFFGRRAEIIGEHFKKGRPIYVEARLKNESWEDKQTGEKRYAMKIIGETFEFVGDPSKRSSETDPDTEAQPRHRADPEPPKSRAAQQPRRPASPPPRPPVDPDLDSADDDIPFKTGLNGVIGNTVSTIAYVASLVLNWLHGKNMQEMRCHKAAIGIL